MSGFLVLPAAVSGLGLGGCNRLDDYTAVALNTPAKRHAITYGSESETLFVEVGGDAQGLSANQEADVWRFVERYKAESTGKIKVAAPKSASGVSRSMLRVEEIIHSAGVPPEAVVMTRYGGGWAGGGPAVKLSYGRPVAVPPECGDWSGDLGENRERLHFENYGCSTQRNLALTVANARDLEEPQAESPRSSERRSVTWTKYVTGDPTQKGADQTNMGAAGTPPPAPPGGRP
jgi:pilus assembly protein CpaD